MSDLLKLYKDFLEGVKRDKVKRRIRIKVEMKRIEKSIAKQSSGEVKINKKVVDSLNKIKEKLKKELEKLR